MGDFNIDLLKSDSHPDSDEFLNLMGSYFFQPHIYPTGITSPSSTLTDNIFFKLIEHSVISGNSGYDFTEHLPNFIIFQNMFSSLSNAKVFNREYSIN